MFRLTVRCVTLGGEKSGLWISNQGRYYQGFILSSYPFPFLPMPMRAAALPFVIPPARRAHDTFAVRPK
jgi:hypothetical protein